MKKSVSFLLTLIAVLLLALTGAAAQESGEKQVKIKITSGNTEITAMLNDTSPARDLIKKLPVTLNLHQHQSREYYAGIRLDKNSPTQDGYQTGDMAYWTPGNSLVLFYGEGYTGSLIIMGKITSGLNLLPAMGNSFTAKIERADN